MRFTDAFLDEIRDRVSVSSVIGRHVQWDRRKSNAGRGDWWAPCPMHAEKTPSFHAEDRKGRYHCFGCKASGDIFTFLIEKEGLSFPEAVERLAGEAGLALPASSPEDRERQQQRASLYDVCEAAARWFQANLKGPVGARAVEYLKSRKLTGADARDWRLGYAPSAKYGLKQALADQKISKERMIEAGLLNAGDDIPVPYDKFRSRLIFPIRDARGRMVGFGGRALEADQQPKYLNSPETPIFSKRRVLYGLDRAREAAHKTGRLLVVEGYMDTIPAVRAGFPTCATLGTSLTEEHLAILWKIVPEPILCFDGDAAGRKAATRAMEIALPALQPGHSLRFAFLPDGQDPDDLLALHGAPGLEEALSRGLGLSDALWELCLSLPRDTPEQRAQMEATTYARVDLIGDRTVQQHYRRDFKDRLWKLFGPQITAGRKNSGFVQRREAAVQARATELQQALARRKAAVAAVTAQAAEGCHDV